MKTLFIAILLTIELLTDRGTLARDGELPSKTAIESALNTACENYQALTEGKNADNIPALAKVDPAIFGIALVTTDGKVYTAGWQIWHRRRFSATGETAFAPREQSPISRMP